MDKPTLDFNTQLVYAGNRWNGKELVSSYFRVVDGKPTGDALTFGRHRGKYIGSIYPASEVEKEWRISKTSSGWLNDDKASLAQWQVLTDEAQVQARRESTAKQLSRESLYQILAPIRLAYMGCDTFGRRAIESHIISVLRG